MEILKIWNSHITPRQANDIAERIGNGEIAILPTDSLYGIACNALDSKAIAEVCRIKGLNPEKNTLSIICSDISMASEYARIEDEGFRMLKELTPGPYTVIFPASRKLPKVFKGRKEVGIRIPDNEVLRQVIEALGHPLVTASVEGDTSDDRVNPDLIAENYSKKGIGIIIDDGESGDEETTVVDFTTQTPEIIREGKGPTDGIFEEG